MSAYTPCQSRSKPCTAISVSGCFTNARVPFFELNGKTLGIIGLGNIGSRVASIGKAFGMDISYFPTSGKAHSAEYPALPLERLLAGSDIISIHCPLNERTKSLIGYEELSMMKRSAYIVNMGRGGIIVENELARALDEGIIAGAAVDVFTREPMPEEHPFLHLKHPERLILTPHIGWASREARECLIRKIAENISNNI